LITLIERENQELEERERQERRKKGSNIGTKPTSKRKENLPAPQDKPRKKKK